MPLFGEIGLGTQYELPKSVKSYRIWASRRGENRKMLKVNELNSYLISKDVHLGVKKIAGVRVPLLENVDFEIRPYSLFNAPRAWALSNAGMMPSSLVSS